MSANLTLTAVDDLEGDTFGEVARTGIATGSSLLTSLVASWKLSDLTDATGRGNTLTNNNSATFNTGKIGNAAYFTAASSQFLSRAGSSADVKMGDIDFTIGFWAYLSTYPSTGNAYQLVTKDVDTPANSRDYDVDFLTDGGGAKHVRFYINGGGTILVEDLSNIPSTGTWFCLIAWHDATANTVNISVNNNTPVSATTSGTAPEDSSAEFRIGARAYSGFEGYLDGRVDNVNLWKKVLSAGERTEFYNSGSGVEYPF
jgi:hypothetical protein